MNIHIIGAGGVASYLVPVLIKTFRPKVLTIQDKDILEKRNLDRQLFSPAQVGMNKAHALAKLNKTDGVIIKVIEEWFEETQDLDPETHVLICVADNHMARNAALAAADMHQDNNIHLIIGGNEYFDNEAYYYTTRLRGTPADPRIRSPEITTDHTGSPLSCQGVAQVASPQLAVANFGCAHKILSLLWTHTEASKKLLDSAKTEEDVTVITRSLPLHISQSLFDTTTTYEA